MSKMDFSSCEEVFHRIKKNTVEKKQDQALGVESDNWIKA